MMQEFTYEIPKITSGLTPDSKLKNTMMLDRCLNLIPWNGQLVTTFDVMPPYKFNNTYTFPFPQLHCGLINFMLYANRIAALDNDFNEIASINTFTQRSWHVADFGAYVVFTNDKMVVTYDIVNGFNNAPELPVFGTCCNFRGQLFVGGFVTPWFDAGRNAVGWSKIGSAVFELDKSNTSGYAMLIDGGEVMRVLPFGDGVMTYTNKEVYFHTPVIEPVPGFREERLDLPGPVSRSAVNGNKRKHVWVDNLGNLWIMEQGKQPQNLNYSHCFRKMLSSDIVVTYDETRDVFNISDANYSYRLSPFGLSEFWQAVTSQTKTQGGLIGIYDDVDNQGFELVTSAFDLGFRGRKTITSVELGITCDQPVFVSIDWKDHLSRHFRATPWYKVNRDGWARPRVEAEEFRVKVQSNATEDVTIDYVKVKYQISDRRNQRGMVSASKTNGGTDSE